MLSESLTPWTHDVAGLVNGTDSEFHRTVVPLSLMIKLTYTATFGLRNRGLRLTAHT